MTNPNPNPNARRIEVLDPLDPGPNQNGEIFMGGTLDARWPSTIPAHVQNPNGLPDPLPASARPIVDPNSNEGEIEDEDLTIAEPVPVIMDSTGLSSLVARCLSNAEADAVTLRNRGSRAAAAAVTLSLARVTITAIDVLARASERARLHQKVDALQQHVLSAPARPNQTETIGISRKPTVGDLLEAKANEVDPLS